MLDIGCTTPKSNHPRYSHIPCSVQILWLFEKGIVFTHPKHRLADTQTGRHTVVHNVIDWFPCPNVGQASTDHDLRLYPGACFSCIVINLHLSFKITLRLLTTGL